MRILVDQSGYDLLNLGDVAMLQGCVARLRQQWPDAEIRVIAHSPDRLHAYCPDTIAIQRTFADLRSLQILPRKARFASEQLWKIAGPLLTARPRRMLRRDDDCLQWPRTAIEATHWADVVVASGAGYLTDTWWWHAAGVLSVLELAQRLGKPTAMFGQGFGPLRGRALRAMAEWVLPGLAVLGLREEVSSPAIARSCGVRRDVTWITGDDAIEVIPPTVPAAADALGFNIRAADYSGVDGQGAVAIGTHVAAAAHELAAPIVGLPVSRYATTSDRAAIRQCLARGQPSIDVDLPDVMSPAELISASGKCRAVVTGSYHAAVFALAQGVPAVCLSNSRYYDAKFAGLSALFPSACTVVPLNEHGAAARLRQAIVHSWELPAGARSAAQESAARQRASARLAYEALRLTVDSPRELPMPVPLRQPT